VYRHRFTAAHEVGHLLLHGDCVPSDIIQEKEAGSFAAEFLTPGEAIRPELTPRMDLKALEQLRKKWLARPIRSSTAVGGWHGFRARLPPGVSTAQPTAQPTAQTWSIRPGTG